MFHSLPTGRTRVSIGYTHKLEPDQSVVGQAVRMLEPHHAVFIDKKILTALE